MSGDTRITNHPAGAMVVAGGVVADDAVEAGGASGGLHRGAAFGAAGVWCGVSELAAGHVSTPHHHGPQATIVYLMTGMMEFAVWDENGDQHTFSAKAGEFAVIPAGVVHAENNPSDEGCLSMVVRTEGEVPTVVNVEL